MSQLAQSLAQAADKNRELLAILAQTDYAPSSLQQNIAYAGDLKHQIAATAAEIKKLHAVTEDERKDHLKYRDSTVKRFAYRLGGQKGKDKFSGKAEKEEREFLEAWQKEREASESKEELEKALARAEGDRPHLEGEKQRHADAQRELDILYQHLFSGPTPEVPGEDQLERAVESCRQQFDQCQGTAEREQNALQATQQAAQAMQEAFRHIESALSASGYDMMGGGGFADMMERDSLANSQNQVMHATRSLNEARRLQPAIRPLSNINIDQGHFFSDVVFDNIFSDMRQHGRIESSQADILKALMELNRQVTEQQKRVKSAQGELQQAGDHLENARRELQDIRAQAFEQFASSGAYSAPPQYAGANVGSAPHAPPAYQV